MKRILLIAVTTLLVVVSQVALAQNLLEDAGFERQQPAVPRFLDNDQPFGEWGCYDLNMNQTKLVTHPSVVHSGGQAIHVVKSPSKLHGGLSQVIKDDVTYGTRLEVSGWVKITSDCNACVSVVAWKAPVQCCDVGNIWKTVEGPCEWTKVEFIYEVPEKRHFPTGIHDVKFGLTLLTKLGEKADAYFDDVKVKVIRR